MSIGILMLDSGFERLPGDIGHASTWNFPVMYAVVRGVTGRMIAEESVESSSSLEPSGESSVPKKPYASFVEPFLDAADELVARGATAIGTSCGFLAALQPELAARCPVPVATSSLLQIPMIQAMLPPSKKVGIVASKAGSLALQLKAIGVHEDLPTTALAHDSAFLHDLMTNNPKVDAEAHERDVMEASKRLIDTYPEVGAIVFECSNFPTHSQAVQEAFGRPVFDVVTMIEWLHAGLSPRRHTRL